MTLTHKETFGLLKPSVDAHTLGMATMASALRSCGYRALTAPADVMEAMTDLRKVNNISRIVGWIKQAGLTVLGFSYRLDPADGRDYFCTLWQLLREYRCFATEGGPLKMLSFAGLPDTCRLVEQALPGQVTTFPGDETPEESLRRYGVPDDLIAKSITPEHPYDRALREFAQDYIASEQFRKVTPADHWGYPECGAAGADGYLPRLHYCRERHSLPIIRVHAGPYSPDREEALRQYNSWVRDLAQSRLLDVLSIGSSQLTQQHFGQSWEGLHNGGGVPVNSELEYRVIADNARPMLVRTYAGTRDVPAMARMHQRALDICWHALSLWWFCQIDGRGDNTLLENLREHIETIRYIASTGKPFEPNVPHHFAFRGSDDVSYIVSAFLAAKLAKVNGIRHLVLQNMLNTPKQTLGVQDVAKGRAMLNLVRRLEDDDFSVSLQNRAGLDYFSPDMDRARVQLAAVTAMMDDILPDDASSPEIIHVVSYSEAVRLATPPVIKESIQITRGALAEYRRRKGEGLRLADDFAPEINARYELLYREASQGVDFLEKHIPNLYTAEGLYRVFADGYLPVPYLVDTRGEFPEATRHATAVVDGGVRVVDPDTGLPVPTLERYRAIFSRTNQ